MEKGKIEKTPYLAERAPNTKENIYTRIVYSANAADVVLTMVHGRVLMSNRKLLQRSGLII